MAAGTSTPAASTAGRRRPINCELALQIQSDEVLLLDGSDTPVDVVVHGDGAYPGIVAYPGVGLYTHSLERYLAWHDTGDCSVDFRDALFPSPGELPE